MSQKPIIHGTNNGTNALESISGVILLIITLF